MTETTVRKIREDELDKLIELYKHLHADDATLPEGGALLALWQNILSNPMLHYLVIEMDYRLVSSCTLAIIPNLTRGARPYGLIENVVTDKNYRRRGLGRSVLNKGLEIAWEAGCYKVMLMTGSKRAETLRFYERSGFNREEKTAFIVKPIGERK